MAGIPALPVDQILLRAQPVDAPALFTGAALYWLQRMARDSAWDRHHRGSCRNRQPFSVDQSAVIRGRTVSVRLFIARSGATYRRLWRVDGHPWRAAEILQAFGA